MSQGQGGDERYVDEAHRYRLDERIATGGMGQVWRGTDTVLGRTVAVKVLKEEFADDATFRSRFASEARNAGALHHPGIATVFDAGEQPVPFLVMEYVDGKPLSELLRAGRSLDPDVAAELMAQAADALAAAHARGIVHRDVKPANLIVTPDQRVKVTDFGIARAAESVALTETGQVMGTPQYLSPEQARGEQATAASDLYSLGVVAFEALAGQRPFAGDTPVTTALAHLRDPVPELPEHVPAGLAAVVRRALAKDPEDRYASAADLAAALRNPSSSSASAAPAVPVPDAAPTATTQRMDQTSVLPVTSVQPASVGTPAVGTAAVSRRRAGLGSWWPAALAAVAGVVLIAVVAAMTAGGDPEDPATPGTTTSDATTAPAKSSEPVTTSAAPSPTGTTPAAQPPKPGKPPKDKNQGKGGGKGKGKKK